MTVIGSFRERGKVRARRPKVTGAPPEPRGKPRRVPALRVTKGVPMLRLANLGGTAMTSPQTLGRGLFIFERMIL